MSMFKIFDISGSAMSAQSVRLNTTASNLANANTVASSREAAYRSRQPVFQTVMNNSAGAATPESAGVRVAGVVETSAEPARLYDPGNPMADKDGYIFMSNVNPVDELVNMISASRSYQSNVEVLNTSKELLMRTLSIGQ
mgnify:FL=1|jgi:flagellar basal-body rod protein FlgC